MLTSALPHHGQLCHGPLYNEPPCDGPPYQSRPRRAQVFSDLSKTPTAQFVIDDKTFDVRHISQTVDAEAAAQWTLTSNMNYFHPFHIHVNPFQVKNTVSGYVVGSFFHDAVLKTNMEPLSMWRDTVFIPPLGSVTIWQRYGTDPSNAWEVDFDESNLPRKEGRLPNRGDVHHTLFAAFNVWQGKTVFHCHFTDHEDQVRACGYTRAHVWAHCCAHVWPAHCSRLCAAVLRA